MEVNVIFGEMKEILESLIVELMKVYVLGYSTKRKAYKCYNKNLTKIVETTNVKVDKNVSKETNIQAGYESDESASWEEEKNKDEDKHKETQVSLGTISKTPRYVQKNYLEIKL